jgi:hypothetical protein
LVNPASYFSTNAHYWRPEHFECHPFVSKSAARAIGAELIAIGKFRAGVALLAAVEMMRSGEALCAGGAARGWR